MGKSKNKKKRSVKKLSFLTLIITFLIFIWYIASDRITPNTDQARVKGLVLSVAPMVNGVCYKGECKFAFRSKKRRHTVLD